MAVSFRRLLAIRLRIDYIIALAVINWRLGSCRRIWRFCDHTVVKGTVVDAQTGRRLNLHIFIGRSILLDCLVNIFVDFNDRF